MKRLIATLVVLLLGFCTPVLAQHSGHGGGGGSRGVTRSSAPSGSRSGAAARYPSGARGGNQPYRGHDRQGYAYAHPFHMAPEHYNAYFGHEHTFFPFHAHPYFGYSALWHPCFWYGGYYFGFSVWPYEVGPWFWAYNDPIYIVVENDTYYAKDDLHPDQEVPLTVATTEPTGTIRIVDQVKGDSIYIDKSLAGYTGELKNFRLAVGQHTIEVKGHGPYFGEDVMVIVDHELTINVGQ